MNENMALLSQDEIDILLNFLADKRTELNGGVLDQESVDKLINLLRAGTFQKLHFDTSLPKITGGIGTAILVLDGEENIGAQQEFCRLEQSIDEKSGYVKILCVNKQSGNRYEMTPTCLEQVRYVADDTSTWGYAIPPLTFDRVASLLQVKYTKSTFDAVCERYAEKMFGDKRHMIPSIYMPSANELIQHLGN